VACGPRPPSAFLTILSPIGRSASTLFCSAADGKKRTGHALKALPVWDGMAAAGGRLYLAMRNGKILCFGCNKWAAQKVLPLVSA